MKKRFRYAAINSEVQNGTFGYYLASPVSDRTRKLIIAERLSYLRQQAKLSQRDLCEIIGIAVTTYSGYEQGKHEPSLETICRLSNLYKISSDFILGVGFQDPYSEEIGHHYLTCKDGYDLGMEHLHESMIHVDIAEHELETSYPDAIAMQDPDDSDE